MQSGDTQIVPFTVIDNCTNESFSSEAIITLEPHSNIVPSTPAYTACYGDIVTITPSPSGGSGDYTYAWSGGSTENPLDIVLNPGNHSVTVTDYNACTEEVSFTIAVMSAECIPNVFTPNGDSDNAIWSLENTFLFSDSEVRVYGRYGKLLFKSIGYASPWDGTNKKGNDVPAGVYFYSIEIGHEFEPIKGTVTILR